ncbi:MAG TPA: ATP-binding cassette domain-containing protein [Amycolatopsis sp.]|nr:ATP-binding cassette domain-containing protein [Amycolatopsis sp.]
MSLLEAEGLVKRFVRRGLLTRNRSETLAVDNVSFGLDRGKTLAVVGESGAGKSTAGRLVLRLIEPDAGAVRFDGRDVTALPHKKLHWLRRRTQMIFQDPYSSCDPRITIGRSVTEPLRVHEGINRSDRERKAVEVLDRVGLDAHYAERLPHELSGGQLQRVAIARALTVEPSLIVCDEPVAALDVSVRAGVLNLMLDLQEEYGIAYLFISHDLSIVEVISHDVAVMRSGTLVEIGDKHQIYSDPRHEYTRQLLDAVPVPDPNRRMFDVDDPAASAPAEDRPTHAQESIIY